MLFVNQVLRQITQSRAFDALQESRDLTVTDGIFTAPPLCRLITRVVAVDQDPSRQQFLPSRGPLHLQGATIVFDRFFPVGASTDWENRNESFTFASATPSVLSTTATLADSAVGKLLRIANVSEVYEVLSVVTGASLSVRPEVTASLTSGTFSIGNFGLNRYQIDERCGTGYNNTIRVEYQRYHPALLSDTDTLLIPVPSSLALRTVARLLQYAKYSVDSQRLQSEILEADAAEMRQETLARPMASSKPDAFSSNRGGTRWKRQRYI